MARVYRLTFLGGNRSCIGMKYAEVELSTLPPSSPSPPFHLNLTRFPSMKKRS
jgi:hypothetical protein